MRLSKSHARQLGPPTPRIPYRTPKFLVGFSRMSRSRTKITAYCSPGTYKYLNGSGVVVGVGVGGSGNTGFDVCVDTTMPKPYVVDHDLSIDHITCEPLRFYGTLKNYPFAGYSTKFNGYNPTNRSLAGSYGPTPPLPNWAYWKTKALSNMNPNKPSLDLLLFLFEFKDFPEMLRNLGNLLSWKGHRKKPRPSDFVDGYLSWSFGWAPLVSDVLTLFDIAKKLDDRNRYLKQLESGARVHRSLGRYPETTVVSPYSDFGGAGVSVKETKGKVWFSANAKLQTTLPNDGTVMNLLTADLVLGLNLRPDTVWNMLPWSWLIDYFSNVGDFLSAQGGFVPWKCTRMCVMAEIDQVDKFRLLVPVPGISINEGNFMRRLSRLRKAYINPTPEITWDPYLTEGQILNLEALATSKFLKGFRS